MAVEAYAAGDYVPGQILVTYKTTANNAMRSRAIRLVGGSLMKKMDTFSVRQVQLPAGMNINSAIKQIEADPSVAFAEPNYRRYFRGVPNDPAFSQQWGLQNTAQAINDTTPVTGTAASDVNMVTAWNLQTGSKNVVVAVIDDSIDIKHPDLYSNIWINTGEIAANGIDDDANGFIDDVYGWDFRNKDNDPTADAAASEGHGTAVAGCIGAIGNNGIGVAGVNWKVSIMPLKFKGDVATEVAAMQYAIDMGANIVNASWGGPTLSLTEKNAVQLLQNAGILLVVAAGNNDLNNAFVPDYPSGYDHPNILTVAASTPSDTLSSWAQFDAIKVDISSPGISVYTTMSPNGSATIGNHQQAGLFYDYINGSSFSAPYVAGIAALLKAQFPAAGFQELKGRILASAVQLNSHQGLVATSGRADANAALTVPAQPVLLINSIVWNDGGNGLPDVNETIDLTVQLENAWKNATGISATLTSLSPTNVTVINNAANYPNIASGALANPVTAFRVHFNANATGYQTIKFKLDITAAGYATTRYFQVSIGSLQNGVAHNGTLMQNDQDDYQFYHIDVPAGSSNLTFTTTSWLDIDLLVNPNNPPSFIPTSYRTGIADPNTLVGTTANGNETITIASPKAGTWYVAVLKEANNPAVNYPFTLSASFTAPAAAATATSTQGAGGGCSIRQQSEFDPLLMLMLIFSLLFFAKERSSKKVN